MPHERIHPDVRVRHISQNQSSRSAGGIHLMVAHDTEGANIKGVRDLIQLGDIFFPSAFQASCAVGVDAEGMSGRYVPDARKAWHCAGFNSMSLGVEQIGKASQLDWPDLQVDEAARWMAIWHHKYGIPIVHGKVEGHEIIRPGIVRHSELGAWGGNHGDPGSNYDLDLLIHRTHHFAELQA